MKIYTSYYGNYKELAKHNIHIIGISRGKPKNIYISKKIQELAPRWEMLKMSDKEYDKHYLKILDNLDPKEIIKKIITLGDGKSVALCCYEKPTDKCHRHMVAKWLNKNSEGKVNIIEEFLTPKMKLKFGISENPETIQISLF